MSGVLSNFLFGNIDDDGNLEDSSYLTAVSIEYKTFQTYCNVHKVFITFSDFYLLLTSTYFKIS